MNLQETWDDLYRKHRLSFVTGLSNEVHERWMDLNVDLIDATKDLFSYLSFRISNEKGKYEVNYSAHERLFLIEIKDLTTNEKILRYDYVGMSYLPDDWYPQINIWKDFFEDLRQRCSEFLSQKEKMI